MPVTFDLLWRHIGPVGSRRRRSAGGWAIRDSRRSCAAGSGEARRGQPVCRHGVGLRRQAGACIAHPDCSKPCWLCPDDGQADGQLPAPHRHDWIGSRRRGLHRLHQRPSHRPGSPRRAACAVTRGVTRRGCRVGLGEVSMSQGAVHGACQCAPDRGGIHAEQKRELICQLTGTVVKSRARTCVRHVGDRRGGQER